MLRMTLVPAVVAAYLGHAAGEPLCANFDEREELSMPDEIRQGLHGGLAQAGAGMVESFPDLFEDPAAAAPRFISNAFVLGSSAAGTACGIVGGGPAFPFCAAVNAGASYMSFLGVNQLVAHEFAGMPYPWDPLEDRIEKLEDAFVCLEEKLAALSDKLAEDLAVSRLAQVASSMSVVRGRVHNLLERTFLCAGNETPPAVREHLCSCEEFFSKLYDTGYFDDTVLVNWAAVHNDVRTLAEELARAPMAPAVAESMGRLIASYSSVLTLVSVCSMTVEAWAAGMTQQCPEAAFVILAFREKVTSSFTKPGIELLHELSDHALARIDRTSPHKTLVGVEVMCVHSAHTEVPPYFNRQGRGAFTQHSLECPSANPAAPCQIVPCRNYGPVQTSCETCGGNETVRNCSWVHDTCMDDSWRRADRGGFWQRASTGFVLPDVALEKCVEFFEPDRTRCGCVMGPDPALSDLNETLRWCPPTRPATQHYDTLHLAIHADLVPAVALVLSSEHRLCACTGGTPAFGGACPANGTEQCARCMAGYRLENQTCVLIVCPEPGDASDANQTVTVTDSLLRPSTRARVACEGPGLCVKGRASWLLRCLEDGSWDTPLAGHRCRPCTTGTVTASASGVCGLCWCCAALAALCAWWSERPQR